ncbi:MAG: hypothetical protein E3J94_03670 [Desulfobacteraceae bacterium]|nr:MAG: hypothetical protein E3J94_03670 [Desulfobacteraceae bacterium]
MGEEVPPEYPPLEDEKWYCMTVNVWSHRGLACYVEYEETVHCCSTGAGIKWLYDNHKVCSPGWLICVSFFIGYQSIDDIAGPFIDQDACNAAC